MSRTRDLGKMITGNAILPTAHVDSDFTVDSDTLFVNATTNRVGIGTDSPTRTLHVAGTGLRVASSGSLFEMGSAATTGTFGTFFKGGTTTAVGYIGTDGGGILGGDSGNNFGIRAEANMILMAGASERARILSGGDVLIGTTSGLGPGARVNVVSGGNTLHLKSTSGSAKNIVGYDTAGSESFNVEGNGKLFSNGRYTYGELRSWSGSTSFVDVFRFNKVPSGTLSHKCIIYGYSSENGGMQPWQIYFYMVDRSNGSPYADFFGLTSTAPGGSLHGGSAPMEFQITNKGVTNGPVFVQVRNTTYGYAFVVNEFYHNYAGYYAEWLV